MLSLSSILGALGLLSVIVSGMPAPEAQLVSRMIRRAESANETCGDYVLDTPSSLQIYSQNTTDETPLSLRSKTLAAAPLNATEGYSTFEFQSCSIQGFTQGYSRNTGGSLGAPIEYWGRVISESDCLTAKMSPARLRLAACNETDSSQWFRLQETLGGPVIDYFPLKNETGYTYEGETPFYFTANTKADSPSPVTFRNTTTYRIIRFTD